MEIVVHLQFCTPLWQGKFPTFFPATQFKFKDGPAGVVQSFAVVDNDVVDVDNDVWHFKITTCNDDISKLTILQNK